MNRLPARDHILTNTDILAVIAEYLPVRLEETSSGPIYFANCPFHDDHAWRLWVDQERRRFGCDKCGHGGDVADFVAAYERITRDEAMDRLVKRLDHTRNDPC